MKRTGLSKPVLEHAILVEIRAMYGCEKVSAVNIASVRDPFGAANWKIEAVDTNDGQMIKCEQDCKNIGRAIAAAQKKLGQVYELRLE